MKKEYKAQAGVEGKYRIRGIIAFSLLMLAAVCAMILCIYSVRSKNFVFAVCYIIAILLGLSYIVIKYNQLFITYVAADDKNIILKAWDNCFFPYNANIKLPIVREFVPAQSEISEIPMEEISTLIIGTKAYVKRNANDDFFEKTVSAYEKNKYGAEARALDRLNILYIKIKNGESCFMSIEQFKPSEVMEVLNRFTRFCSDDVFIKISSREYKKYLKRPEADMNKKE